MFELLPPVWKYRGKVMSLSSDAAGGVFREAAGQPASDGDHCPECGQKYKVTCRCKMHHCTCPNGHHWHLCPDCRTVVSGAGSHDGSADNRCAKCAVEFQARDKAFNPDQKRDDRGRFAADGHGGLADAHAAVFSQTHDAVAAAPDHAGRVAAVKGLTGRLARATHAHGRKAVVGAIRQSGLHPSLWKSVGSRMMDHVGSLVSTHHTALTESGMHGNLVGESKSGDAAGVGGLMHEHAKDLAATHEDELVGTHGAMSKDLMKHLVKSGMDQGDAEDYASHLSDQFAYRMHPPLRDQHEGGSEEHTREKGACASTQIDLPTPVANQFTAIGEAIDPDHLAEDGLEREAHITICYGLLCSVDQVKAAVKDVGPVEYQFGEFRVFEHDGKPDVLYVSVVSRDLIRLNRLLALLPCKPSDYDEYTPHATIAYLKAGLGAAYAAAFNGSLKIDGGGIATEFTFSNPDKIATTVPLTNVITAVPAPELVREKSHQDGDPDDDECDDCDSEPARDITHAALQLFGSGLEGYDDGGGQDVREKQFKPAHKGKGPGGGQFTSGGGGWSSGAKSGPSKPAKGGKPSTAVSKPANPSKRNSAANSRQAAPSPPAGSSHAQQVQEGMDWLRSHPAAPPSRRSPQPATPATPRPAGDVHPGSFRDRVRAERALPALPVAVAKKVQAAAIPVAKKVQAHPRGPSIVQRANAWADRMAEQHAGKIAHRFGGDHEKAKRALSAVIRHMAHAARKGGQPVKGGIHGLNFTVRKKAFDPDSAFQPSLFDDVPMAPEVSADPVAVPASGGPVAVAPGACPSCASKESHPFRSPVYSLGCESCGSKHLLSPWGQSKGYPTFMPLGYHAVTNHAGQFIRFEPIQSAAPPDDDVDGLSPTE